MAIAPVIKSISPDTGTVGDGITDVNELMLVGTAGANSTVNVFDGTTLLGATTANSSGAWAFEAKALSNGAHSFTATSADATGTSPVSAPMGVTVVPNITSFSGANGSSITIDGMSAGVNNANQPWSLTEPDNHTLRFEVRVGDYWSTSGWSDLINDGGAGRSEIGLSPTYAPGTQVNVSYQLTVEPGAANTADWLLLNQMHATTQGPPPFAVEMDGEHMQVVLRYQKPGQTSATEVVAWRDPNPIQRGHSYDMNIQVNFDPNGNGYLNVWRDGVQIVKYQGAIGMAGASYYWKEGIYRSHTASETMAADYSNLNITTGAAAAPTTLTQLTTATTPITPNVAATTSSTTPATPTTSTADTTPSTTSTPSVTRPDLTIADDSLWVAGRGGKVDLGVTVKTTDPNDLVTVNITGLPRYETITDKLDGRTFRGNNMTLTAAQVDSGLVLQSNYRGGGHPVATLTLTANAKDPVTGAVTSAAPKTITVTDPRPAATTSPQTNHHHTNHHHTSASTVAATAPQPITAMDHLPAVAAGAGVLANRGFAQLQQHMGLGTSTLAATAPQAITLADHLPAAGTATASLASQSFALLNQYLAGNSGRVDPGQIVAAVSQAAGRGQETFLTRPQH